MSDNREILLLQVGHVHDLVAVTVSWSFYYKGLWGISTAISELSEQINLKF